MLTLLLYGGCCSRRCDDAVFAMHICCSTCHSRRVLTTTLVFYMQGKTSQQSNVNNTSYHIKPHFFMANCRQYASFLCDLIWMFYVVSFLFIRQHQTESNDLVTLNSDLLLQNVCYLRHSTCCMILPGCTAFSLYVMAHLTHYLIWRCSFDLWYCDLKTRPLFLLKFR